MTTQKACDLCHMFRQNVDGTPAVHRYSLRRETPGWRINGGRNQESRGGIDLCDPCWETIAAPRMRGRTK